MECNSRTPLNNKISFNNIESTIYNYPKLRLNHLVPSIKNKVIFTSKYNDDDNISLNEIKPMNIGNNYNNKFNINDININKWYFNKDILKDKSINDIIIMFNNELLNNNKKINDLENSTQKLKTIIQKSQNQIKSSNMFINNQNNQIKKLVYICIYCVIIY